MLVKDIHQQFELGNPVAEFDQGLSHYFLVTDAKIIQGGFVNLTHGYARKTDITWYDEDLMVLLCQRIRNNHEILRTVGLNRENNRHLFHVDVEQARLYARALMDIGFFESVGDTYKIPFLYRASLNITQGKAFNGNG